MAKPNEKLADALRALKKLQNKHGGAIESNDLKEVHRTVLVHDGFLRPVIKGWYVCANPSDMDGDSTAWYANFWPFLAGYLRKRFGKHYSLNAEASILIHTQCTVIPRQIVIVTNEGGASTLYLPHDTSVMLYADEKNLPKHRIDVHGLQVIPLPEVLCRVGPQFFKNNPREAEIALNLVRDPGELLSILLSGDDMLASAGRLVGALRFIGRGGSADRILDTMRRAKHDIRETNPFETSTPTLGYSRERSPLAMRIKSMWAAWRDDVLSVFPPAPGLPVRPVDYLARLDEQYAADAYNSLSIEGYRVNDELIARVAKGDWNPNGNIGDKNSRDALAARGYFQAFRAVKSSLGEILAGKNPGEIVRAAHHTWAGELFAPSVSAGILDPHHLAGYRNGPVYIRNSQHTPPPCSALLDAMEALFDLIEKEPEASVRAVLGHHLFVFIHPYFDGNGRIGRFLMNSMLASGGYPWTIVLLRNRDKYMSALENASVGGDIKPFARLVVEEMGRKTDFND